MFDIGIAELALVAIVALIVVGPKDLPGMFRTVGQYVGKARGMARQFQRAMDDAARENDLDELRNVGNMMKSASDPMGAARKATMDYTNRFKEDLDGSTISREEQVKQANAAAEAYVPPVPEAAEEPVPAKAEAEAPAEPEETPKAS